MPVELGERAVREELARQLAGSHEKPGGIVWVKDGDEVVVWLDSLRVELAPRRSVSASTSRQTRPGATSRRS